MVFVIQLVCFLVALFGDKKVLTLLLAVIACFVPDEVPLIDEFVYLALAIKQLND